jgi:hypothetical protein
MEAVSTSEMSVNLYVTTQLKILEDSHICTHCCENLKPFECFLLYECLDCYMCLKPGLIQEGNNTRFIDEIYEKG